MEVFGFIFVTIFVSMFIYMLLSDDAADFLHQRLEKISSTGRSRKQVNKVQEVKKVLMLIFRPVLTNMAQKKKNQKDLKQFLTEAGYPSSDDDIVRFIAKRLFYGFIGLMFSVFFLIIGRFSLNAVMMAVCIPFLAFLLPLIMLRGTAKRRANEIMYNLPDALDLLTVCVEAGLGLDAALARVAKEYARTSEILSSEFERVSKDIQAGIPRQTAFRNLANRNNVQDLQSLVALLIQTDKLGTSIAQSLRVYGDSVRTRRRQRVETLAQKASVKMIIPLVFFILPAMFVVILAPAAISLSKTMK